MALYTLKQHYCNTVLTSQHQCNNGCNTYYIHWSQQITMFLQYCTHITTLIQKWLQHIIYCIGHQSQQITAAINYS